MSSLKLTSFAFVFAFFCTYTLASQAPVPASVSQSSATPKSAAATPATSATSAAILRGTVTDPDLAVVPGATVTVTPVKGAPLTTTSAADGSYSIRNIPTGTYSVTITMPGFASAARQGQKFLTGQVVNMDVKLAIEQNATEVSVTTSSNQVSVDADSNASSVTIKDKDLDALSDDPDELSSELSALAGPSAGPNGGQIYVDGFTGGQLPPKSSIREIRVNQNPFSAQYEKPGYGRVEVLTKPGTDKFHGTASIQGNTSSVNTASPFLHGASAPAYHSLFFLGSLNGPISSKASFSTAGSYRDIQDNAIVNSFIPLDSTGNFCNPGNLTCTFSQFNTAVFQPRKRYDFTPRIDLALSEKNTLIVRYQLEHGSQQGIFNGGFSLQSTGTTSSNKSNQIQVSDSHIFSPRVINEVRFEFERETSQATPTSSAAAVTVQGNFTGGGNTPQINSNTQDHIEVQNYTSIQLNKNFIRMGGRLRTTGESLTSFGGSNGSFTYSPVGTLTAQQAYLNNRPSQYSLTQINTATVNQRITDVGLYFEDDFKPKPNLTISAGTRYEVESIINSSHDFAPRASVAYGVPRKTGSPTTVLRVGLGIFNTRFEIGDTINALRQNGLNQVQLIYATPPQGCSPTNPAACGQAGTARNTVRTLAPHLRSEYIVQYAVGVDQQISKTASLSVNYIASHGFHQFLSRVTSVTPTAYNYQYQSEGNYHQNQFIVNGNYRPSRAFSLFGYYAYSQADGNANGPDNFPSDSTNPRTDYGRATFNNTHRLFLFGNFSLPYEFTLSPFMVAGSGSPYSITTGTDLNQDSIFNDRPAYIAGAASTSCLSTAGYNPTPGAGYTPIPVNTCTAGSTFSFNLRAVKGFGFGKKPGGNVAGGSQGGPGAGGPGGRGPGGGRGGDRGGFGGGGGSSNHHYNFSIGAQAFNLFNVVPYAAPIGNLSSPYFGKSIALAGGFGGNNSAVRRVQLQLNFNF